MSAARRRALWRAHAFYLGLQQMRKLVRRRPDQPHRVASRGEVIVGWL
jgi:hypothetical protein